MKVYIVNVNNCEAYSDYLEENRGVYSSREKAIDAMTAQGFDAQTKIRLIPWSCAGKHWLEDGEYRREEYRIEEWELDERTCRNTDSEFPFFECSECGCNAVVGYGSSGDGLPKYCPNCGAKVVGE